MFNQIDATSNIVDASMEIFTILLWAFVLGMMLWWLLKPDTRREFTKSIWVWYSQKKKSKKKKQKEAKKEIKKDDILLIEWIGPKIALLLEENWIITFNDIVQADVLWLEEILNKAGGKFKSHNPTTWPDQARLARDDSWTELEEYQEILGKSKKKKEKAS